MIAVNEITAQNWQVSTGEPGEVAQALDDISQSLILVLTTIPGTDILRPDFGSGLFEYLDAPINQAAAAIKKAVTFDVEKWEPRVKVSSVEILPTDKNTLDISVAWQLLAGDISGIAYLNYAPAGVSITQPPIIVFTNPQTSGLASTQDWQINTDEYGATVAGANEISQAILLAITTMPGTDLLRPIFGSGLFEYTDRPLFSAAAPISQAIRQAVGVWEPRAEIKTLSFAYQSQPDESVQSGIIFRLVWRLRGEDAQGQTDILLQLDNAGTQTAAPVINIRILATENGEALTTEGSAFIQI